MPSSRREASAFIVFLCGVMSLVQFVAACLGLYYWTTVELDGMHIAIYSGMTL